MCHILDAAIFHYITRGFHVFLLKQVSSLFKGSSFQLFANAVASGGTIKALAIPGGGSKFSATALKKGDLYQQTIKSGAKGLPFLKIMDEGTCYNSF